MIDAAGAIYVIGGTGGTGNTYYKDVWVSANGGDAAGLGVGGWSAGTLGGYYGGTTG